MRWLATAVAAIAPVLVVAGCGSSGAKKPTTSGGSPPTAIRASPTVTVPPLATARVREEIRVARASNKLLSIFPTVPGTARCAILDGAIETKPIPGTCETTIRARRTMEPSWSVTFTETWPPCLSGYCPPPYRWRHHTWRVIEGETIVKPGTKPHVYAIHSRGATAPQDYK